MKKIIINKFLNTILFVVFAMVMEIISFLFMFKNLENTYLFLDFFFLIFLTFPTYIIKNKIANIVYLSLILLIFSFLLVVNVSFYGVGKDIFSLQYLTLINEGMSLVTTSHINFNHIVILLLLNLIFVFVIVLINKKEKIIVDKYYRKASLLTIIVLLLSSSCHLLSLNIVKYFEKNYNNNATVDMITLAKPANYQKYGMLTYYSEEANYLYLNNSVNIEELKKYFKINENTKNEFTGLLKDYNVVTIMIETGDTMMVNETLTPNLYSLMNDGVNCINNYSKNKTNVSEYLAISGNYPTLGLNLSKNNYVLPFTIPNMLNDNYKTLYFHDVGSKRDIYSRKKLMPILGFDESHFHEEIYPTIEEWHWGGNYQLDSKTEQYVTNQLLKDTSQPFYGFWTTLSMHGPYDTSANKIKLKNLYYNDLKAAEEKSLWVNPLKDETNGNKECMEIYMMEVMDFDVALGNMIQKFKEKGEYDNTLFVIFGDHELYYNGADGKPLNLVLHNTDTLNHYEIFDTVLTFYNPKLNEMVKEKKMYNFSSPNIIVPTILDLLGIKYNPNFYMGSSLFSSAFNQTQVFYSYEISTFFNNQFWSKDGVGVDIIFDEKGNSTDFLEVVSKYIEKQVKIDKIYKNNIFEKYDFSEFNY